MSWFGGKNKEKQKQYSGFLGDCSEQQEQILNKFKLHVKTNNKVPIQQFDDIYLLRFLRARKFDLQKTIKMWDDFIQWRVKNNIENCHKFKFPELPQLRKLYPHGYHKVDKKFRPIYIERVGFIDVDKIFKVMETQDMLNYYALLYETLLTTIFDGCTQYQQMKTGETGRVMQTVTILDLKNVKLGNASKAYDFVKPVSAMAQNNYPQILGNMFIINAPMLFTGIWAIVKMWIDDKTKQKIKILGSSYKKQILELIEPENLPAFLDGGKCNCGGKECRLEANIGPWNPEGKQLFEENLTMVQAKQNQKKGYHKEQVLLSSPDVLVQIEVKDDATNQIPPVITQSMQHGSQQDEVLKKVKQIDLRQNQPEQNEKKDEKVDDKVQKEPDVIEGTQTKQLPEAKPKETTDEMREQKKNQPEEYSGNKEEQKVEKDNEDNDEKIEEKYQKPEVVQPTKEDKPVSSQSNKENDQI